MSSALCVLQFMHTDMSRSWAGRVSCRDRAALRRATGGPCTLTLGFHVPSPWGSTGPHLAAPCILTVSHALTLGFCSHISSL